MNWSTASALGGLWMWRMTSGEYVRRGSVMESGRGHRQGGRGVNRKPRMGAGEREDSRSCPALQQC